MLRCHTLKQGLFTLRSIHSSHRRRPCSIGWICFTWGKVSDGISLAYVFAKKPSLKHFGKRWRVKFDCLQVRIFDLNLGSNAAIEGPLLLWTWRRGQGWWSFWVWCNISIYSIWTPKGQSSCEKYGIFYLVKGVTCLRLTVDQRLKLRQYSKLEATLEA